MRNRPENASVRGPTPAECEVLQHAASILTGLGVALQDLPALLKAHETISRLSEASAAQPLATPIQNFSQVLKLPAGTNHAFEHSPWFTAANGQQDALPLPTSCAIPSTQMLREAESISSLDHHDMEYLDLFAETLGQQRSANAGTTTRVYSSGEELLDNTTQYYVDDLTPWHHSFLGPSSMNIEYPLWSSTPSAPEILPPACTVRVSAVDSCQAAENQAPYSNISAQQAAEWSSGGQATPQSSGNPSGRGAVPEQSWLHESAGDPYPDVSSNDHSKVERLVTIYRELGLPVSREGPHRDPRRRTQKGVVNKRKPRGAFKDARQRVETALTRKCKACLRCRKQKIRCKLDPDNPFGKCQTCQTISGPTLTTLPCLRYKISDTQLLDKGPHPRLSWTRRWNRMEVVEIDEWASDEIRTITLTQDVGNACYDLQVREFVPKYGDSMHRIWKSKEVQQQYLCAPYAIANMVQTASLFTRFVDANVETFIEHYTDETDKLIRNTYLMAYRYGQIVESKAEASLLQSVLRLWVACRMENKQERLCGRECLGMEPQLFDAEADNYGKICVPPVMQAQIEILTTVMILLPMKQAVLQGLEKLVMSNDPKAWFTIYLVMFIVLHSCGLLTKAERARCLREALVGSTERYYNPAIVNEFHMGANIMLAHFHYCNKGGHPFAMDWSHPQQATFARLDAEQVQFLQESIKAISLRSVDFKRIRDDHEYENEFFFVSQLYDFDWRPVRTVF